MPAGCCVPACPLQEEAAAKAKAKEELKAFLQSNEVNERLREEARQKEFKDDIRWVGGWTLVACTRRPQSRRHGSTTAVR